MVELVFKVENLKKYFLIKRGFIESLKGVL